MAPRVIQISARELVGDDELLRRARAASAPTLAIQLRDPELSGHALYQLGRALRATTEQHGGRLIVNDRLDLARVLRADGVHLGRCSTSVADARAFLGARAWVSVSAHDLDDVGRACDAAASAVLLSPIFVSPGKGSALGLDVLDRARALLQGSGVHLFALGGVTCERAAACFDAGADGVAAIRADLTPLL